MHGGALIEHETTSAADGTYRVDAPIADRAAWQGESESWLWWIAVSADGFASRVFTRERNLDPEAPPGETRLDVVLADGATVEGRVVVAESGAPVADARVVLVAFHDRFVFPNRAGGTFENPLGERVVAETQSDVEGRFELHQAPTRATADADDGDALPHFMQLFVVTPEFATAFADVPLEADGAVIERTIELWRSAIVRGRVVDATIYPNFTAWAQFVTPGFNDL